VPGLVPSLSNNFLYHKTPTSFRSEQRAALSIGLKMNFIGCAGIFGFGGYMQGLFHCSNGNSWSATEIPCGFQLNSQVYLSFYEVWSEAAEFTYYIMGGGPTGSLISIGCSNISLILLKIGWKVSIHVSAWHMWNHFSIKPTIHKLWSKIKMLHIIVLSLNEVHQILCENTHTQTFGTKLFSD